MNREAFTRPRTHVVICCHATHIYAHPRMPRSVEVSSVEQVGDVVAEEPKLEADVRPWVNNLEEAAKSVWNRLRTIRMYEWLVVGHKIAYLSTFRSLPIRSLIEQIGIDPSAKRFVVILSLCADVRYRNLGM